MGLRAVEEILARIELQNQAIARRQPSVAPIIYPVEWVLRGSVSTPLTAVRMVLRPRRA